MAHEIWTGRMAEEDLIGTVEGAISYEYYKKIEHQYEDVTEDQWYEYCIANQPHRPNEKPDPSNPYHTYANEVHKQLVQRLLGNINQAKYLEFYTAVGSFLDYKYGIDGFYRLIDPATNQERRVPIDLTKNPSKTNPKADVIIFIPEDLDQLENGDSVFDLFVRDSVKAVEGAFRKA